MPLTDIARIRLTSQQIANSRSKTFKDVLDSMVAMQAQDYAMAKWALGIRLPGATDQDVEGAIRRGEILRTHLLRPTWHFVSADDIYWLLALTAPRIRASMKSRENELELSEAIFRKSNAVLGKALRDGRHLTREELVAELGKAKIATDHNRASHLFVRAELDGIVCSGATRAGKQTYALLEKRVPHKKPLDRETALAALASKYFLSRCPATLTDFIWWSGLTASQAKIALELVKSDFFPETIDGHTYWLPKSFVNSPGEEKSAYLLPAFDEFLISYTDRGVVLPPGILSRAVSQNGIFRPVIVANGQALGIWKRAVRRDKVLVKTDLYTTPSQAMRDMVEKAALPFGRFLEKTPEINYEP